MDSTHYEQFLGEAAQWCARLAAPDVSARDRDACERWQSQSAEHRAAFRHLQALEARLHDSILLDPRLQALADHAYHAADDLPDDPVLLDERRAKKTQELSAHWIQNRAAVATAAGLALTLALAWWIAEPRAALVSAGRVSVLQAPARETLHSNLPDGSVIHLDAGAKLQVRITSVERRIELLHGRAYFEVAHDARRPFAVLANGTRTVALGTKFEVDTQDDHTQVTLAEGSVAVDGSSGGSHWEERLRPGEQLDTEGPSSQPRLRKVDATTHSSWASGWLEFRNAPLSEALSEVNRYAAKQVVIADDALLDMKVAGRFVMGDSQAIVAALAEVLPIRVVDGGSHEFILFKRYENE